MTFLEKNRVWGKRYRSKPGYREYNRLRLAEWRRKNPERHRELSRNSYHKHKAKAKETQKLWIKNNKGKKYSIIARRRAIKKLATVNSSGISEWMTRVLSLDSYTCAYCKRNISTRWMHFDHIVPLSRGGAHSLENLCTACPECNLSKQNKLCHEWNERN